MVRVLASVIDCERVRSGRAAQTEDKETPSPMTQEPVLQIVEYNNIKY